MPITRLIRYDDLSPRMRDYIGSWQVFRALGFPADRLYCMSARSAQHGGVLSAFLHLEAQGREFDLELGAIENEDVFQAEYKRVATMLSANPLEIPEGDLDRMREESEAFRDKAGLMYALLKKGFRLTGPEGNRAARRARKAQERS